MRGPNSRSRRLRSAQSSLATGVQSSCRSMRWLVEMQLVIFGLTVTSSWGNGHSTLWRGLIRHLSRRGWKVTFFEKDVPYYRDTRDRNWLEGGSLVLYS